MNCSRRRTLQLLGAVSCLGATAGCLDSGSLDEYALVGSELDLSSIEPPFLWPDPTAIEATTRVDFTTETKRQLITELFDTGRVTVQQWPLVWRVQWGQETQPRPTFLQREGRFYEVQIVDQQSLDRERWHFAVERIDGEPPDDATVANPPLEFSEQDTRVLQAALDAVYAGNDGFLGDPEFDEVPTVEYHRYLDTEASELVPSPPFEFLDYENESFRAITDQRRVAVPEWTYTIDEFATTRQEFNEYARSSIIEHDLNSADLSESAHDAVETAISEDPGERYEEGAPPSETLSEILRALDIAGDLQPIDAYEYRVDFKNVVAEYRESVYQFSLIVTPTE
jgi:hypothetical protein